MNRSGLTKYLPFAATLATLLLLPGLALAQSTNADLSSLVPSVGSLSPSFSAATISYKDNVPAGTPSITLTPTAADAGATIKVNGTAVTSGSASGTITLSTGITTVTTVVTAASGATKTYTLKVNLGIVIVSQATGYSDSSKSKIATSHLGTTLLSYDATGVDKLVFAIGTEAGYNNSTIDVTGVTFNGVALTQVVEEHTYLGDRDGGTAEIWVLDSPYQGAGTFTFAFTSGGGGINGAFVSIVGLSGTANGSAGIGATARSFTALGPVNTSITTTAANSLVIAMVENSGNNNASGTPTASSPLTQIANGVYGSQWASVATGYQSVTTAGTTLTPTFSTNTGAAYSIHVVAVAFDPPVPTQYWDVNSNAAGAGGPIATGTWSGTDMNWDQKSDGTDFTSLWSAGSTAVFAAGTDANGIYNVSLQGTQDITGLTFEEGTVTLANGASGALRLTGTTVAANVAAGLTATVAVPVGEDTAGRQLAKVGAGTLILSGDSTYTGTTTVAQGTLDLAGNNSSAIGAMALTGGVTQFESLNSIDGSGVNVTLGSGAALVFGGSFSDSDIPTALGRIVTTSAGVIAADNHASTNFNFSGAGLTAASFGAIGNVSFNGVLTPQGSTYRLGGGGGTLTMANSNAVTGTGKSLAVGGNVVLALANDYDTGTTLNSGTLSVGDDSSLGGGTLTFNGGTLQSADSTAHVLANALAFGGNVTVGGTGNMTFSNTAATALGASRSFTINNPITTFAQSFSGSGFGITKGGNGTLVLSGNNSYTGLTAINAGTVTMSGNNTGTGGITLTAGTLNINNDHALGNSGTFTINGGTIDNTKGGAVNISVAIPITLGANFTYGGSNPLNLGSGAVTNGGGRTVTMNGTNTTLTVGGVMTNTQNNVQTTTSNGVGNTVVLGGYALSSNGTSRIDIMNGTGNFTITGPVTDGGTATASGLTYSGTGTLSLGGTNTYRGATAVSSGTLKLTAGALANTAITASGTGTFAVQPGSTITISAGNTLTAGAGASLNLGGRIFDMTDGFISTFNLVQESTFASTALTVTTGATFKLNLSDAGADLLAVTKSAAVSGTVNVTLDTTGASSLTPGIYNLITAASGLTTSSPTWQFTGGGTTKTVTVGLASYDLTLNASDTAISVTVANSGPRPVDHFDISAISSPQTTGIPITGITISAKDSSNNFTAGFTGTVTFGGTGGFSGISANFTAGALTGVSVTPTVGGSNLTLTVDDGAGHTGTTTIATIQTQYQIWSGGATFAADANNDGIANGMAWLLGASDPSANAAGLLPVPTDSGGNLVLTFDCQSAANRGPAVLKLQYSNDLGVTSLWSGHEAVVPGTAGTSDVAGVHFVATTNGSLIHIVATIPASAASGNGNLFGRLSATEN